MKRVFKTKKKVSGSKATYRPWKEWKEGEFIIGTYKGHKIDSYDKPNWLIEVIEAGLMNKKASAALVGQVIGLNSSGKLDKAMEQVEEGEIVQITYNGTSTIEKGKYKGKDAHDIEVDIVEEEGDEDAEEDEDEEADEDDGFEDDDGEDEADEDDL
jgi:hypothetical protein